MTSDAQPDSGTRLRGLWLRLAQVGWVLIALLSMGLFALGTVAQFHHLRKPCTEVPVEEQADCWPTEHALNQFGFTWDDLAVYYTTVATAALAPLPLLGWLVFWRKPGNVVGLLFSLAMVTTGSVSLSRFLVGDLLRAYPDLSLPALFVQFLGSMAPLLYASLFPDGRFVPSWMRWLVLLWAGRSLHFSVLLFVEPSLSGSFLTKLLSLAFVPFMAVSVYAVLYRYRRVAGPLQRQQIKWIVVGAVIVIPISTGGYILNQFWQPGFIDLFIVAVYSPLFYLSILFLAVCLGISIFRYRLWDIDLIIRRTLIYGTMTAALAGIYFGSVVLLQSGFRGLTGQESQVAIVLSTLAIAALFVPVRRHIQQVIDRRFYRSKYDAEKVLSAFGATVREEVDLERLTDRLLAVVQETMQPAQVSLWLKTSPPPAAPPLLTPQRQESPLRSASGGLRTGPGGEA